jgi:Arc/MetJ-type ribon-helix-helix transcriptional regulator
MPTPLRAVRVPDEIWIPALVASKERRESLSEVIREALVKYARNRKP